MNGNCEVGTYVNDIFCLGVIHANEYQIKQGFLREQGLRNLTTQRNALTLSCYSGWNIKFHVISFGDIIVTFVLLSQGLNSTCYGLNKQYSIYLCR